MLKKIALLSSVILSAIGVYLLSGLIDTEVLSRGEFAFRLPLPEEIARQYDVPLYPDVEKVILTGFFSDWDENDENYAMVPETEDPHNQRWSTAIILPPGEHQYKYAVYIKGRENPVWTQDRFSPEQVNNGMNSYNSIIRIGRFSLFREILRYLIYALLLLLFILLFPLIFHGTGRKRALILLSCLLAASNIGFFLFHLISDRQYYSFISRSVISILENDLNHSTDSPYSVFNRFLWHKMDKIGIRNFEDRYKYASLLFFDRDFHLKDFDYRTFNNYHLDNPLSLKSSGELVYPYFRNQIEKLQKQDVNEKTYLLPASLRLYYKNHLPGTGKNLESGKSVIQLSARTYLFPYVEENSITGYLGIYFSDRNRAITDSFLIFNMAALLFFTALIFLFNTLKKDDENLDDLLQVFTERYGITARECEIIPYILEGMTNKEIAGDLNISKRTVDNHIYNILHKASVKNRVELIHIIKNSR